MIEYVGEELEEEKAGRCVALLLLVKSTPNRCSFLSPAQSGDCFETFSIQLFFLCPC